MGVSGGHDPSVKSGVVPAVLEAQCAFRRSPAHKNPHP